MVSPWQASDNAVTLGGMDSEFDADSDMPLPMPSAGLSGARPAVAPPEAAKRRSTMATLLVNGLSDEEIARAMASEYGMGEDECEVLRVQVAERMMAESDARKPFKKSMAEKRIHRHIASASKRGAWGAVANLEAQLARIQGTEEPLEQRITTDVRLQTATLQVLGSLSNEQVEALVSEELRRLPKHI